MRETAALGLAKQGDVAAGGALITGAKQEPWPFVRRAELQALGRLCVAGGTDLMIRATERDVDEVRRAALIGLGRCRDPRARTIFLHTLKQHDENASLRALSAGLLAQSGDKGAAPEMAAALHTIVGESEADMALQGVVVAVLRALAHLGGPDAVNAAVTLAGDAAPPVSRRGGRGVGDAVRSRRGERGPEVAGGRRRSVAGARRRARPEALRQVRPQVGPLILTFSPRAGRRDRSVA